MVTSLTFDPMIKKVKMIFPASEKRKIENLFPESCSSIEYFSSNIYKFEKVSNMAAIYLIGSTQMTSWGTTSCTNLNLFLQILNSEIVLNLIIVNFVNKTHDKCVLNEMKL